MILVSGATGQNGSAAIREFARRGEPVRALGRSAAKAVSAGVEPSTRVRPSLPREPARSSDHTPSLRAICRCKALAPFPARHLLP
jgi:nucleoside-diphosphate-sugar epimerase